MLRHLLLIITLAVTLALPISALAERILVLGDSLSAAYRMPQDRGWVALMQQRLDQEFPAWTVINASISGETSAGGLRRLPQLLRKHDPAIVLLELGGNDGLRGQSTSTLRDNLARMIELTREHGSQPVLLGIRIPPNYGRRYTRRFDAVFHDLAQAQALPLVPFILEGVADNPALMQADGIHPEAAAQALILDQIWPVIPPLINNAR